MPGKYAGVLLSAILLSSTTIARSAPQVSDGFETANLTAPNGPSPAINVSSFTWGATNYTQVVGLVNGQSTAVYGARGAINVAYPGVDFSCKTGNYCLRFAYAPGGYMSEQRFFLGRHYPDVWVGYWLRVPTNFYHGSMNNKFAAFWTSVYDGPGDVTWQTRPTGSGNAKLVVQDGGTSQPEIDAYNNFINVNTDRGRWMQVAIRMRPASASGANNGIIEFYRRWNNESTYTLLYRKTNARFYEGGQGVYEGYLMGWANDPYAASTDWLLDDFTVSAESLVADNSTVSAPPSPPILRVEPL